jgi:hypothetical protein
MNNLPTLLDPAAVATELIGAHTPAATPPTVPDQGAQTVPAVTPTPDGQIDKAGRVFDAARYKSNPDGTPFRNRLGYFMPKGGRGAKKAVSVPMESASAPQAEAAPVVSAPALPPPSAPAWSEAEKNAAAAPAPEAVAPGVGTAEPVVNAAAPVVDCSGDAAKAISSGVFVFVGFAFDARDEVTPGKAEQGHLCDATAAWVRSTGWRGGPLAGMLLAWAAYFLGIAEKPKVSAKLKKWLGSEKRAAPIEVKTTRVETPQPETEARMTSAPATTAPGLGTRY